MPAREPASKPRGLSEVGAVGVAPARIVPQEVHTWIERQYTIRDVVDMTDLTEWQVYKEIRSGRLRAIVRRGMERGYRVAQSELDRWAAEEWEPVRR